MNTTLTRKSTSTPRKTRAGYVSSCVTAQICPDCGSDIFVNEEVFDKDLGRLKFFECSTCGWKNYTTQSVLSGKHS